MRWYLLRDRRHEGPYSKEDIIEGLRAKKIDPRDYCLPEKAEADQSSFAYITAEDVVGPEAFFDLQKKPAVTEDSDTGLFEIDTGVASAQAPGDSTASHMDSLREEFEEGLESTQLVRIRELQRKAAQGQGGAASSSDGATRAPWKILGGLAIVLLVVAALVQPAMKFLGSSAEVPISASSSSAPSGATATVRQNRIAPSNVKLPDTRRPAEESNSPAFAAPRGDEATSEPVTKRRKKRRSSETEAADAVEEDAEAGTDTENFDEEDYVEEDESEEDVDEADI